MCATFQAWSPGKTTSLGANVTRAGEKEGFEAGEGPEEVKWGQVGQRDWQLQQMP